ncbi:Card1-like endonuclease domain-containing protein [Chryseobacterium sp. 22458]|uniref:Card1-like endonuclease domain-containing protein n=1 Tax=Chryseobacterium sp. 22458 TaxID=3453921 RepID=UPI003F847286
MKHHICLVGGQILPLYMGIVESNPDTIHFFYTSETENNVKILKSFFKEKKTESYKCSESNYTLFLRELNDLLSKISNNENVDFNITGGTKIMALAAYDMIRERKSTAYYFNQDLSYYEVPSFKLKNVNNSIKIVDFIRLSNNSISSSTSILDYSTADFMMAKSIFNFSNTNSKQFNQIQKYFKNLFNDSDEIPIKGDEEVNDNLFVTWDRNLLEVNDCSSLLLEVTGNNIKDLFFKAGWWELVTAAAVKDWSLQKEIVMNVVFPFKGDTSESKNEIDILINTGRKLIFVECKSGIINQADLNKMKAVREIYGGRIAKSLLVCKFKPTDRILEKCSELDIEIFYYYDKTTRGTNSLSSIHKKLDEINKKSSI